MESKPIKFFLRAGDIQIADIASLCNNFHLNLIYDLYLEGVLERWLSIHDYEKEHGELKVFEEQFGKTPLDEEKARKFCHIFFPGEEQALEPIFQNFRLYEKWKKESEAMSQWDDQWFERIHDYHEKYAALKQGIVEDSRNMPAVKAHLLELSTRYLGLFRLDWQACLDFFEREAPVALLLMLANSELRAFMEEEGIAIERVKKFVRTNLPSSQTQTETKALSPFVFPAEEEETYVSSIKVTSKHTQAMWEDLEPHEEKSYMILSIAPSCSIRPYRAQGQELNEEQKQDFPIIHGIDYRSDSNTENLIYMEV